MARQFEDAHAINQKMTTLPHNIEAERAVLGACMLQPAVMGEVITELAPESFYRPAHQVIYQALCDLHQKHDALDAITVADRLEATGQMELVGSSTDGRLYIAELMDSRLSLINWEQHSAIVKRLAIQRELIYASAEITSLAYDAPDDINIIVEEAEKSLFKVTEKRIKSQFVKMDTLLNNSIEELLKLAERQTQIAGVPSGFKDVDDLFGGFRGGDLVILAARPGVGKTSFALNLATNAAKAGTTVVFLSLEMGASQLTTRILCSEARVNLGNVRSGKTKESDWERIVEAANRLNSLDLYIDDTPGLSILELKAKARRELRDVKNGLIIVDYLQLMQGSNLRKEVNRTNEVAEISRGLKILAKEMDMPVIALSQLSRAIEQRGSAKRPMLSDLRESGSIEQDADIVMFIDRSMDELEAESDKRPDLGTAQLIVAKHRNGPTRDITLSFAAESTRFGDYIDDARIPDYAC